ncbi:hypothetical protein Q5P01_015679 [Channa striata]|uniref:Uncharacterized protein n=1 Tax=Channa striata TaxID=64152 RepID=A0AA88SEU4_CHASR|nr:hypothetical protein Q5P01_015679 [Channa striata]
MNPGNEANRSPKAEVLLFVVRKLDRNTRELDGTANRAAQITAYAITKAQIAGRDASERVLRSQTMRQVRDEAGKVPGDLGEMGSRLRRVRETFVNEVKEGWKDGSRQIKK